MENKPDDIKSIESRIAKLLPDKKTSALQKRVSSNFTTAAAVGFRVSIDLLSGVLFGGLIGYFLDYFFVTKPLFLVMFLFLGACAGFLNIYRFAKGYDKTQDGD